MIKHEIKIEFQDLKALKNLIEKTYFKDEQMGKLISNSNYIEINEKSNDVIYSILKGLDGNTIKIINENIIDGSLRFMVNETNNEIRIYPISIYCINDNGKYIFW
jgi:hypothetical protein